ncbi:helix-turn-helix transcriptional regulator [Vannielia litorea]|uniref:helix-turn-helix transcriptional regulator n=1 Tax=Vannielia litorea TaxID=1217970 RepID=UPI001C937CD6|nr:helix-turn-helix transcriptional regulator [Vannielia litorea]MBY6048882.1 helix-turn-helix transcriptional regulator [Vannielia litorea]MBY6076296.1 helix-turn-helix transcriptional regulator [Vannielia litorea]
MQANTALLLVILVVQTLCALFFVGEILSSVIGFAPLSWQVHEFIEIGAALGLLLGILLGGIALRRTMSRNAALGHQLHAASSAFMDLLEERIAAWGLTPAERDVAIFAVKGLTIPEIASLRQTSEGTVKAQTAAIYRKAGVNGRPQLLSLFIEELMESGMNERLAASTLAATPPPARPQPAEAAEATPR